ncbi:SNF2-related protein [Frankia sp. AgPm24]|uniref:DEAD/DEAH box helicase n=1 Tax=Frankia sp. AgPm24 TaxID=631128 RepID=UPI002010A2DE|nr:DEAD/DEAH box helicase [Frankia sp. AgPm24]MCK9922746.1 SNF2-related protein [Frankia sp. AgPm24]
MLPAELRYVDRNRLRAIVGETTYRRGERYARNGAVSGVSWQPSITSLTGRVAGSYGENYRTTAAFTRGTRACPWEFRGGDCSCPVSVDCKHTAALVLAAAQAAAYVHMAATETPPSIPTPDARDLAVPRRGSAAPVATTVPTIRVPGLGPGSGTASRSGRVVRGAGQPRRTAGPPAWDSALSDLLTEAPRHAVPRAATPLAIELSLFAAGAPVQAAHALPSTLVMARLVQPGKNGWINAPTWSQLASSHGTFRDGGFDDDQVSVLREIHAVHQAGDEYAAYHRHGDTRYLDLSEFRSPRLWPLLDEARAVGVRLVHHRKRLGDIEPPLSARPCLDVTADQQGLVLCPVLRVDGSDVDLIPFAFLGDHGAVALDRAELEATGQFENGRLRLVRFTSPAPPALLQLAASDQAMRIPGADRARFLADYYPRLARLAPVISSDGSFDPPPLPRPTLVARAAFGDSHLVQIDWEWDYAPAGDPSPASDGGDSDGGGASAGAAPRRLPLYDDGPQDAYRDQAAEAEILANLTLPDAAGALVLPDAAGTLRRPGPSGVAGTAGGPGTVTLRGADTIRFATELLPQLTAHDGLTVEIAGEAPDYHDAGDTLRIELSTREAKDEPDWFDLGVALVLDGQRVAFTMLFEALSRDDPFLILDSGAYLRLDRPDLHSLRRLIEEAAALRDSPHGALRLSRFQAGLWEELVALGVVVHQAQAWRTQVRGILAFETAGATRPPESLLATLRPYQADGFRWLTFLWDLRLGGILADDMGLGKTLQSLALICHARDRDPGLAPFLIVAPTSVVANWATEAARFAPHLRVAAITDTLRRRGQTLPDIMAGADVVITSYTLFRLDTEDYRAATWAGLILDEAQTVKNHQSKAYQCARLLPAPFKLAVTGTPLENNVMELWSLLSITAPGLFPNRARFQEYYARPIEKLGDSDLLGQLRSRIRPLLIRRTKEQVAPDLPAKQEQVIDVDLHPRHRRIYQVQLQRERQRVLGLVDDLNRNRFTILQSLTTLRQLSLHAGLVDEAHDALASAKIDVLLEQLRDVIDGGHRALVFSQFTRFLGRVRDALTAAGIEFCYLDGTTRDRPSVLRRFKSGAAPVFLISLKAGGTGLNLTEADYCFLLDPWWNPATEAQAVDRVHRIGQTRNVMVYRLVARDTIEEKVMALKARKAELFASVLDGGEFVDTTLDADDIRQLLS